MGETPWEEGRDGTEVVYSERLWPAWWVWLLIPGLICVLAIAYGAAYDPLWGWLIFLVGTLLSWTLLAAAAPTLRVDESVFRAGSARLPRWAIGPVEVLDREGARETLRRGDARAYLLVRSWAAPGAILVRVADPDDPHPYWLVTSRRPERLSVALTGGRDRVSDDRPAE